MQLFKKELCELKFKNYKKFTTERQGKGRNWFQSIRQLYLRKVREQRRVYDMREKETDFINYN